MEKNTSERLYITLLFFVKSGKENVFLEYEAAVLPILPKYNGTLHYRIRPEQTAFIKPTEVIPYEIHLVSFASATDFENYRQDSERKQHTPLFQESVEKVILIEGKSMY
ncbi:DUF1330 domain-containing protein [Cytophagaceae bacterium DM2B3-1]|uniref:DUF1330 domain-containing protein n=1 Tax=Xanthocytophaga flava TaxID=3048013 RepID=A0ABT7CR39_9BACT|nr:DUF1330 domain-containing protein [Xanthocytophaga flavus]MDJ1466220.1 DUF1330 domain-containing protein [Xanthocytophaga flavus]MDJ1495425.1 DUF1330 domain-containing protein [Xanthocytophaga flavus]